MEYLFDADLSSRFWAKVDKNGPIPAHCPEIGPCWIWTAARNPYRGDYGIIWVKFAVRVPGKPTGQTLLAHRVSWVLANGPIPDELLALHRCDDPPCIRPDHLFLGTDEINSADQVLKGRARPDFRTPAPAVRTVLRPSPPQVKLTDDMVRAIRRRRLGKERSADLALEYGVSRTTINYVASGRRRSSVR